MPTMNFGKLKKFSEY